jgi:hypothetical protein
MQLTGAAVILCSLAADCQRQVEAADARHAAAAEDAERRLAAALEDAARQLEAAEARHSAAAEEARRHIQGREAGLVEERAEKAATLEGHRQLRQLLGEAEAGRAEAQVQLAAAEAQLRVAREQKEEEVARCEQHVL